MSCAVLAAATSSVAKDINRIAFGSCSKESKDQPIWDSINKDQPDIFAMLGDNIYADTNSIDVINNKYQKLAAKPGFKKMKNTSQIVAIWDDHDYGQNDAGKEYSLKHESRTAFLKFFEEPPESPRWTRDSGIYTSYTWESSGKSIQMILLDTRWNRDALNSVGKSAYFSERAPKNMGPYSPVLSKESKLLGEEQWLWIENELNKPADLRFICSGIQILPEFSGWESWANFPHERQRMLKTIQKTKANGIIFLSGDTHWAEFSKISPEIGYPLWELTSSGLTEEWKQVSPNKHRIGPFTHKANYGLIDLNLSAPNPTITLSIKNADGLIQIQNTLSLSDLQFN